MTQVNKQWAKVTQDGVELSWNHEQEGPMSAEDVAKFYVDSVKALQQFKADDPRTFPELRKAEKARQDFRKDAKLIAKTVIWLLVAVGFMVVFCGGDPRGGGGY
jgi:hypothetical protein